MFERKNIDKMIADGRLDQRIREVYGCHVRETAGYADRFRKAAAKFEKIFPDNPSGNIGLYSAPGRTEIGGNHTDHQQGCVLSGSVSLDTIAAAAPNGTETVRFYSEGYGMTSVDLHELKPQETEKNTSAALIRGMASLAAAKGFAVHGFDAYCLSSVLSGSGLSSSAAFETLNGVILGNLFCSDALDAVEIAKMGQQAENVFFGKPCGLQDQTASSVGGLVAIDFQDPRNPKIEKIPPMADMGYQLCIIDSHSSHDDLTGEYAAIPAEMNAVAAFFGKEHLRGITADNLLVNAKAIREQCGDRALLRAFHFVRENIRAKEEASAVKAGNYPEFLRLVNESGRSSWMYLQNTAVPGSVRHQAVNTALALCDMILDGRGAFRVHGGGFAGTIQAFVPQDMVEEFQEKIEQVLGKGSCYRLNIRPAGGTVI